MILENFTTIRCKKCGWIKQFQPSKIYTPEDFVCNCNKVKEKPMSTLDKYKEIADRLGVQYRSDIKESTLKKKIEEAQNGKES